jgi:hypothetical protein
MRRRETMTFPRHPTLERIVRRLKPSAESFAAAAALYGPDLMLQLQATPRAVKGPAVSGMRSRSREIAPRRRGAAPALPSRHEVNSCPAK